MSSRKTATADQPSCSGKFLLARQLGNPSMKGILQVMNLPQDTIEEHVKKDESMDIMCHIDLTGTYFKIKSFYIQDLVNEPRVEILPIGEEIVEGSKTTLVTSNNRHKVVIKKSMSTVCGFVEYTDTKEIVDPKEAARTIPDDYAETPAFYLRQTVKVKNHECKKEHTAIRYYLPVQP